MKFIEKPEKYLCEVSQSVNVRFCFCRKTGEDFTATTVFFRCKDFFSDILAVRDGRKRGAAEIYGFRASPGSHSTFIAVKGLSKDPTEFLVGLLGKCKTIKIDDVWVILLEAKWCGNPTIISYITSLLRANEYSNHNPVDRVAVSFSKTRDISELLRLTPRWKKYAKRNPSVSDIHNRAGIASFCEDRLCY